MDFTLRIYRKLLVTMIHHGYQFLTFEEYCAMLPGERPSRFVILRHDVDLRAENSLYTARIENELGIRASYYFRVVSQSNKPEIIRGIAALGHEIGYHYEDMSITNGNIEMAYAHFMQHLDYFRQYYPVRTICMHGAPTSKWDGRDLWKYYDYKSLGIIGEPYFDVDFEDIYYLTDTGRRWDGYKVSVRDKIPQYHDQWAEQGWIYRYTINIINAVKHNTLPVRMMMTTHPQRWTNDLLGWLKELLLQSVKNIVKRLFLVK